MLLFPVMEKLFPSFNMASEATLILQPEPRLTFPSKMISPHTSQMLLAYLWSNVPIFCLPIAKSPLLTGTLIVILPPPYFVNINMLINEYGELTCYFKREIVEVHV